jgi:phospholipase C
MTAARAPIPSATDPIRHVVVLALENRSFDQMLGCLQPELPGLDGIDPTAPPRQNFIQTGPPFEQRPTEHTVVAPDPKHELRNVLLQIKAQNAYFVLDYALEYTETTREQRMDIMAYHRPNFLPALHALARNFTVCDAWFSSVPGPTWPNRLFLLSGTSLGHTDMPSSVFNPNLHWYDQDTIFDRLNECQRSWQIYAGDFPLSLLFVHQLKPENLARLSDFDRFLKDARSVEAAFPEFAFIEPGYVGSNADDDHPPHNVLRGEQLLAQVYNALRANTALWESTLLVVIFDEHGGFYDHVSPPADAVPPDDHIETFAFRQLSVRVPALLVSPWVENRVCKIRFDHTTLLKYLIDKWDLGPLGNRTATANTFAPFIRRSGSPRTDTPATIPVPVVPSTTTVEVRELTENERVIVTLSEQLETRSLAAPEGSARRVMEAMSHSPHVRDDVRERLRVFLDTHRRN